jgi:NitT/TauT family transport system substrate-binding protein
MQPNQPRTAFVTTVVLAIALLVACAPPAQSPAASAPQAPAAPGAPAAAPAAPVQRETVTVAIPRKTFGYLPLYVAEAKGYFAQESIDPSTVELQCNLVIAALQRGDLKLSGCGTFGLRAAVENDIPLKSLIFSYNKATFVFVANKSITSLPAMRDKNVGISAFGAETHEIAKRLLAKHGLQSERDYAFLVVGAGPQVFAALQSGAVHAAMLNTDEAARIGTENFNVLATTEEVGDLLPIPFSGFQALEETVRKDAEMLRRWLRAYVRALISIRDNPEDAARIAAAELSMDIEEARQAVALTVPVIAKDRPGYASPEGMQFLLEYATGGDTRGKTAAQFTDFSLLDQIYARGIPAP